MAQFSETTNPEAQRAGPDVAEARYSYSVRVPEDLRIQSQAKASPKKSLAEKLLHRIFRAFPPSDPIFKPPEGRSRLEYDDEGRSPFHSWFNVGPELFLGKDVLDLGSGFGGRSIRYVEYGARSVTGLEVDIDKTVLASAFAKLSRAGNVRFLAGAGETLPIRSATFDLLCMYDVMEHVVSPAEVLAECRRVLRPGGVLALTFPPYYALKGGSHLHGYATDFPGLNLFFPTRTLRRAVGSWLDQQSVDYRPFFRQAPTDKLFNMNGLTMRRYAQLVRASGLSIDYVHYTAHLEGRLMATQRLPLPLKKTLIRATKWAACLPAVGEVWCARISALLRK